MSNIYECDYKKNTECNKENCVLNGGDCHRTFYEQYAITGGEGMRNYLKEMLEIQGNFQKRVDPRCNSEDLKERVQFIMDHTIYLEAELQEVLYELPYFKKWKDYSKMTDSEINIAMSKARAEYIDVLHFFMNLGIALGMSAEDMYVGYINKNIENIRRQEDGYTHDKSYR